MTVIAPKLTSTRPSKRQSSPRDTFNVGAKTDLNFNQHGNANWSVLNRVLSTDAKPSQILGSIKADGAVYVINRNGIIFGGTSQVNVGSLIASSLDIHGGAIEYQVGATEQRGAPRATCASSTASCAANPASNRDVPLTLLRRHGHERGRRPDQAGRDLRRL